MIAITDLRDRRFFINPEWIELVEENPETQIVLTNGRRFYVKETAREIVDRYIAYRRQCHTPMRPAVQSGLPEQIEPNEQEKAEPMKEN